MEFDALVAASSNGLEILSYSLEIDYNLSGKFTPVTGNVVNSMSLTHLVTGLQKGKTYAFRYRVKNEYGWGLYSPVALLLVATEPS